MLPAPLRRAASPLLAALVCAAVLAVPCTPSAAAITTVHARTAPDEATWLRDVAVAMQGSRKDLRARVAASPDAMLAINLDIDNTSLATYFDRGQPVVRVRNYARLATRLGVTVFFNTGRLRRELGAVPQQLARAGYVVGGICTRALGERLVPGKQRCRDEFAAQGYTLIANIGNNDTDLEGDGYERAYRLPDYDRTLG